MKPKLITYILSKHNRPVQLSPVQSLEEVIPNVEIVKREGIYFACNLSWPNVTHV